MYVLKFGLEGLYWFSSEYNAWGFVLTAKNRGIAIPVDLDSQVNQMFEKSNNVMNKAKVWINAKLNKRESIASVSRDYRNIIEGLQVIVDTFLRAFR